MARWWRAPATPAEDSALVAAPSWQLTATCNLNFRGLNTLCWLLKVPKHRYTQIYFSKMISFWLVKIGSYYGVQGWPWAKRLKLFSILCLSSWVLDLQQCALMLENKKTSIVTKFLFSVSHPVSSNQVKSTRTCQFSDYLWCCTGFVLKICWFSFFDVSLTTK